MSAVVVKYGVNGSKTMSLDVGDAPKTLKCAGKEMPTGYVLEVTFYGEGYYIYDDIARIAKNGKVRRHAIGGREMASDIVISAGKYPSSSPLPIEIKTAKEMDAILLNGEVGGIYKFIGDTTDIYENGGLYVLGEEDT